MLKALEIVGFKSFADKTRFDFPPGITVVVGPNGSGKSNVVDAIKWVLGEQSAKSLRGKDMSDVIFKGAGSGNGRRPSNTAEATIILENQDRRLDHDADEVHVTRRVYRSGEGEYLINGEPCRLKDIKDLFRGTGIGTDAYSLIEQGKVDRLLQASTKERRAIFEEAAGISRFKAKKVEAQRRLARVEQNLLRLSDIVDEVGSRYRSVKAQASKAARYREFSDRLRQLRVELAFTDFRDQSQKIAELTAEDQQLSGNLSDSEEELRRVESQLEEFQTQINQTSDNLLELEGQASKVREEISRHENTVASESRRQEEIAERQQLVTEQLTQQDYRLEELTTALNQAEDQRRTVADKIEAVQKQLNTVEAERDALRQELTSRNSAADDLTEQQVAQEKKWAEQQRQSFELEAKLNAIKKECQQQEQLLDDLTGQIQRVAMDLSEVEAAEKKLKDETAEKDSALADARERWSESRRLLTEATDLLQELKADRTGVSQRASVIEELEKRFEGVQSGSRFVLDLARTEHSPFGTVHGMVADLIQVQVQHATLIDGILGDWSQFVVSDGPQLTAWLEANEPEIAGRVGIFRLENLPTPDAGHRIDLSGLPDVVGRADQVVSVEPRFQQLIYFLLGNVWIVKDLAAALKLARNQGHSVRFVTLKGEMVEPDGAIVLGPPANDMSLISRRSELRSLKRKLIELEQQVESQTTLVKELKSRTRLGEQEVERLLHEHTQVSRELSEHEVRRKNLQQNLDDLKNSRDQARGRLDTLIESRDATATELTRHADAMTESDRNLQDVIRQKTDLLDTIEQSRSLLKEKEDRFNRLNLDLATTQKNLEGLESSLEQTRSSLDQAQRQREQTAAEQAANETRLVECKERIESAQTEIGQATVIRDDLTNKVVELSDLRKSIVAKREELQQANSELTGNVRQWQSRKHRIELELGQLESSLQTLQERLRDDYGIELAGLKENNIEFVIEDRAEAEQEIEDLRRKITGIGAVNTDALAELEDLEGRYLALESQYNDLVQAKDSLERIIVRINSDSRKIFVETLNAIRTNFQALYRKNFGGGKADIVLEEGVDELEAGIDIVATPPGKAEFSNSLLSGGEKALTAVSLLLAIFQFRPSPFCVLDEVDAPFDEANIGRFVEVLKSFLSWTRFVVVTHSKKTMTAADTLYGVTMLESGISTKVSVRFEDVDDKGNIAQSAVEKSQAESESDKGVA